MIAPTKKPKQRRGLDTMTAIIKANQQIPPNKKHELKEFIISHYDVAANTVFPRSLSAYKKDEFSKLKGAGYAFTDEIHVIEHAAYSELLDQNVSYRDQAALSEQACQQTQAALLASEERVMALEAELAGVRKTSEFLDAQYYKQRDELKECKVKAEKFDFLIKENDTLKGEKKQLEEVFRHQCEELREVVNTFDHAHVGRRLSWSLVNEYKNQKAKLEMIKSIVLTIEGKGTKQAAEILDLLKASK